MQRMMKRRQTGFGTNRERGNTDCGQGMDCGRRQSEGGRYGREEGPGRKRRYRFRSCSGNGR